jgi:hypothetical protein
MTVSKKGAAHAATIRLYARAAEKFTQMRARMFPCHTADMLPVSVSAFPSAHIEGGADSTNEEDPQGRAIPKAREAARIRPHKRCTPGLRTARRRHKS